MALSRIMEGEMDRALSSVGLTAREFAALLEIGIVPLAEGEALDLDHTTRGVTTRGAAGGERAVRAVSLESAASQKRSTSEECTAVVQPAKPRPVGVTHRALAARLGLGPAATCELLGRLERRKLIRRDVPAADIHPRPRGRPEACVISAPAGNILLAAAAGIARKVEDDWADRLAEAAGSAWRDLGVARANGLKRWLTASAAALREPRSAAPGKPRAGRQARRSAKSAAPPGQPNR